MVGIGVLSALANRTVCTEWAALDHAISAAAVQQWRHCPTTCVKASGRHFKAFIVTAQAYINVTCLADR